MSRVNGRKRKIEFETDVRVQGRSVVVQARPTFAVVRLKGTRGGFIVPWDAVYHLDAKILARFGYGGEEQ